MRTAIRTAPYDSNEYPKFFHLPQRVKVWLSGDDPDCEELQHFESYEIAGRLEDFYRHEIDKGRSFRQSFPWDCPLKAMGSDAVLVFHDIRRDSEGTICNLHCNVVKREEFEKEYVISRLNGSFDESFTTYNSKPVDTSDVNLSNDLIALNEKIATYFHDKYDRRTSLVTIKLIIKLGGKIEF